MARDTSDSPGSRHSNPADAEDLIEPFGSAAAGTAQTRHHKGLDSDWPPFAPGHGRSGARSHASRRWVQLPMKQDIPQVDRPSSPGVLRSM